MNPEVFNGNKLRWKFENIAQVTDGTLTSEKLSIGPVDWILSVSSSSDPNGLEYLTIFLIYASPNKHNKNWICAMNGKFKLLNQRGKGKNAVDYIEDHYCKGSISWGLDVLNMNRVLDEHQGFVEVGSIVVDIEFNFRYYDFSKKIEKFTDIIVIVEDTEFHLNKWSLGSRSEYFYKLFMSSDDENLKIIKLQDITSVNFCLMLASFDPFFTTDFKNLYVELIKTAKVFCVPSLHQKMELMLCSQEIVLSSMELMSLADENDYVQLLKKCIDSLQTSANIKSLQADVRFVGLRDVTKLRIMNRLLDIL